jgi:hypothetical protein
MFWYHSISNHPLAASRMNVSMSSTNSLSSDSIPGTVFWRVLTAVWRRVLYSSVEGGDVRADRVYIATTAMRAGICFSSNEDVVVVASVVASADNRCTRFRDGVPAPLTLSPIALRIEDTPAKTCGDAAGVFNALHSVRITVINHSGSSLDAPLGRFAVDFNVRVFDGVGLLGVAFAEATRDFFGVMGAGGAAGSACLVVARAVLR